MKAVAINCLMCDLCKRTVFFGLIFHGNVNVVDVMSPGADAGGIVGDNFPGDKKEGEDEILVERSKVRDRVKRSVFHFGCFKKIYDDIMVDIQSCQRDRGLVLDIDGSSPAASNSIKG